MASTLAKKVLSRTLTPASRASAYVFNHVPQQSLMHGPKRSHLKKTRMGPFLLSWWPQHIRTLAPDFKDQDELYWAAKQAYKRNRGDKIVKKVRRLAHGFLLGRTPPRTPFL